jgi:hypothetical protein
METGNFPQTTGKCSTPNREKLCAEQPRNSLPKRRPLVFITARRQDGDSAEQATLRQMVQSLRHRHAPVLKGKDLGWEGLKPRRGVEYAMSLRSDSASCDYNFIALIEITSEFGFVLPTTDFGTS